MKSKCTCLEVELKDTSSAFDCIVMLQCTRRWCALAQEQNVELKYWRFDDLHHLLPLAFCNECCFICVSALLRCTANTKLRRKDINNAHQRTLALNKAIAILKAGFWIEVVSPGLVTHVVLEPHEAAPVMCRTGLKLTSAYELR